MAKMCFCCSFNSMNIFHGGHLFFCKEICLLKTLIFSVIFWRWETNSKPCCICLLWTALILFVRFKDEIFSLQILNLIPWLGEGCHIPTRFLQPHPLCTSAVMEYTMIRHSHPLALPWRYHEPRCASMGWDLMSSL